VRDFLLVDPGTIQEVRFVLFHEKALSAYVSALDAMFPSS
jgi:hypothetical protein